MISSTMAIEQVVGGFEIEVRAGLGREGGSRDDDVFRYVRSPLPSWVKSVDDPRYVQLERIALEAAKAAVDYSGKNIVLKMSVVDYSGKNIVLKISMDE